MIVHENNLKIIRKQFNVILLCYKNSLFIRCEISCLSKQGQSDINQQQYKAYSEWICIPENMTTTIIHFLRYQTHQSNTSSTIHQIYVPLNLKHKP